MLQSDAGINAMRDYWEKKRLAKAKRLAKGKPKWKDEKVATIEEREAYIDRFLELEDDEDGNPLRPTLDQVKINKDLMMLKLKYQRVESNPLLEEE